MDSTSEDLDLDSLMGLIDDSELLENDSCSNSENILLNQDATKVFENCVPIEHENKHVLKDIPLNLSPVKEVSLTKILTDTKSLPILQDNMSSSEDEESKPFLTEEGKLLKKKIAPASKYSLQVPKSKISTWKSSAQSRSTFSKELSTPHLDKSHIEHYSGIRIINPLITFDVMQQRMEGRRMIKMSFVKAFSKGRDIEGDWVTIGVLVNKLPPKTSKNGKTYSIWKMTDLHDCEKIVSMFLFGTAHAEHWKMSIGTVIGFLNPSIMPDKDKNSNDMCLSIDHPGKLMCMGKSKDFSNCKGKKKDGTKCTAVVNLAQCEFCIYHVKKEYKKFSAKRSELQAAYSGREPSLKDKLLKKQNVFYGGQMFTPSEKAKKPSKKCNTKDKLTLLNLGLKRKADALETEEKVKGVKKLAELYGPEILKTAEKNSEFLNTQLAIPSAGSKNLLHHIIKDKCEKSTDNVKVITSKELLKMRDDYKKTKRANSMSSFDIQSSLPQIGRGLKPGQTVNLDFNSTRSTKLHSTSDFAKMKAILKIKDKGPIKRQDPNSVKSSSDVSMKVQSVLNNSIEEHKDNEEKTIKSRLGSINMNSEKVKRMLNRKSSHAYEIEMADIEKQERYFNTLENKEKMEEKMASTTEMVCSVVSCKQCKYTAHQATDLCKTEGHPLKCHKAIKRFFVCKDCHWRTCCFTRLPKRSCRKCGGSNYERTSMLKPRDGPKLDSEILKIRGEEIKFL